MVSFNFSDTGSVEDYMPSVGEDITSILANSVITKTDLIGIIIVIILIIVAHIVLKHVIRKVLTGKVDKANIEGVIILVTWVIIIIGVICICPLLHLEPTVLFILIGVIGVFAGFASQSVMANFAAGLLLIFEHPISYGQYIETEEYKGHVIKIGFLSTTLRTKFGVYIRVPNNIIFNSNLMNHSADCTHGFEMQINISHSKDIHPAQEVILKVLDEDPTVLKNPQPFVNVSDITDDYVTLAAYQWVPSPIWEDAKKILLLTKIYRALLDAGIGIPHDQIDDKCSDDDNDDETAKAKKEIYPKPEFKT